MYAGDWFMRAAAVPCSLILALALCNEPSQSATAFLMYFFILLLGPVIIAGGWGAALGAEILDREQTRSAGRATFLGLVVAGVSFVTYLLILCFCLSGFGLDPRSSFFGLFILFLVYGSLLVGWLVALVGALAGALLYKRQ